MNDTGFRTVQEAAEIIGITTQAVYLRIKNGQLPAHRQGHLVLIPKDAVYAAARDGVQQPWGLKKRDPAQDSVGVGAD